MRRRDFLTFLAGAMGGWPSAVRAQQKAMPVIGWLYGGSPPPPNTNSPASAAFRKGLSETGYVEGQNLAIEFRWAEFRYDRLPGMAADLVGSKVGGYGTHKSHSRSRRRIIRSAAYRTIETD